MAFSNLFNITISIFSFLCKSRLPKNIKIKVKDSRNMPGVAQRVPGGLGFQFSMKFGT